MHSPHLPSRRPSIARSRAALLLLLPLGGGAFAGDIQIEADSEIGKAPLPGGEVEYFEQLDLELTRIGSSLTDEVVSSTKVQQRAAKAPAVITVITAEEIQARGYGSVAEALRSVPGLYDAYDLVSHNFGVRGINGGPRAGGNILKLMIDGQPVDFRPATTNFFGEELIPLGAIERIEIIRGPASALYGASAFLGVVNIITRQGGEVSGTEVTVQATSIRERQPGAGAQVVQGGASGKVDFLIGAGTWFQARSGLKLPESSPAVLRTDAPERFRDASYGDVSRPRTFFAKVGSPVGPGHLTFLATMQYLNSSAEFQDVAPLTHSSRVSLFNQTYRLSYEMPVGEAFNLRAAVAYARATPTADENLDVGRPDFSVVRSVGNDGMSFSAEGQYVAARWNAAAGVDASVDNHLLEAYDQRLKVDALGVDGSVSRPAGAIIPGIGRGARARFTDFGAYAQVIIDWTPSLSTTLGTRLDQQDPYGFNWSNRVGVVYAPPDQPLTFKLLYGSSFKPPSAEQLFTQPMIVGDLKGTPNLTAQTAHTFELAGGYGFGKARGEVLLNVFAMNVNHRVEFVPRAFYLLAENVDDEWVLGAELTFAYALTADLQLTGALSVARTSARIALSPIIDFREVSNPLYPFVQAHLGAQYSLPIKGLAISGEASYVSARAASQANANLYGQSYQLPWYPYTALSLSFTRQFLKGKDTRAALRASNLLNWKWADSGFSGIEIPTQGRTIQLIATQSF